MRICGNPNCRTGPGGKPADLDAIDGLRGDAKSCSPACRAARSRAKAEPDEQASREFWRHLEAITGQPMIAPTPARLQARERGLTGRVSAGGRSNAANTV